MFRYDRLEELVKETGKKKNYLGQKMGFSGRYLIDAKKQKTDIKGIPLKILAYELGTTAEYLTGETDKKEKPSAVGEELDETRRKINSFVDKATPSQRELILSFLETAMKMGEDNGSV